MGRIQSAAASTSSATITGTAPAISKSAWM
jgi:hypothetical protein